MSRFRKDHIKMAEVIIVDNFLQIYSRSIVNTWISLVGAIHITKSKGRTSLLFHNGLSEVFFENILLIDNIIATVYHISYICCKIHGKINDEKAFISAKLHDKLSKNSSNFCR